MAFAPALLSAASSSSSSPAPYMQQRPSRLSRISSRTDTEIFDDGKGEKRHTIYYMNIEVGRKKYYLHKRYTEFLMLHQRLCEQQYPEIEDFDFPGKVWFTSFSDRVIEYRRTRFEAYLTLLLELVNKYPPLRKEVEAFLGVPQVIDPPKRYPKTPIPGRNGKPAGGEKPLALLDDSASAAAALEKAAESGGGVTGAGAISSNNGAGRLPGSGGVLARRWSREQLPTASSPSSAAYPAAPAPASPQPTAQQRRPRSSDLMALRVLMQLFFVYVLLVGALAAAVALDPSRARPCALSIVGLSCAAALLVPRAVAQARALQTRTA